MPIRIAKTTIAEPLYIAPLLKDHDLMIVFVFYLMEVRMSTIKIGKSFWGRAKLQTLHTALSTSAA